MTLVAVGSGEIEPAAEVLTGELVDDPRDAYRPVIVDRSDSARLNVPSLIAAWIASQMSPATRDGYRRDIDLWLEWLAHWDVHPFDAERGHADSWARYMEKEPGKRGKPATRATVNRRLSCVSSFYEYAVTEQVLEHNRVKRATRHKMNKKDSTTFRPSVEQVEKIIAVAKRHSARSWALVALLIFSGARVSEVLGANLEDISEDMGQRTFRVVRKGGVVAELPLNPVEVVGGALDAYLSQRAKAAHVRPQDLTGPIFMDRVGKPLTRQAAGRLVLRLGELAGITNRRLTPHSLRHVFATIGKLAGATKDELQEWLGHESGETTERYIARVNRYDNHPGRLIAEYLGVTA